MYIDDEPKESPNYCDPNRDLLDMCQQARNYRRQANPRIRFPMPCPHFNAEKAYEVGIGVVTDMLRREFGL